MRNASANGKFSSRPQKNKTAPSSLGRSLQIAKIFRDACAVRCAGKTLKTVFWQGWKDSNLRIPESKSGALTTWRHPCPFRSTLSAQSAIDGRMFLKNLRNVSPRGIRHGAERLCGVLFRVEKRKNRGAGSRHSGTGAECLQGFSDFRIDPYSNGLQIVSADRLGPLIAELLRKRRNFQGFRVSCQGWMLKNQRCSGGLRRHDDCRPG